MSFDNGWTAANKHAITHKHEGADVNDTENDYAVMHEHETEWQRQRKATTKKKVEDGSRHNRCSPDLERPRIHPLDATDTLMQIK